VLLPDSPPEPRPPSEPPKDSRRDSPGCLLQAIQALPAVHRPGDTRQVADDSPVARHGPFPPRGFCDLTAYIASLLFDAQFVKPHSVVQAGQAVLTSLTTTSRSPSSAGWRTRNAAEGVCRHHFGCASGASALCQGHLAPQLNIEPIHQRVGSLRVVKEHSDLISRNDSLHPWRRPVKSGEAVLRSS
jgi:hypothetical protein